MKVKDYYIPVPMFNANLYVYLHKNGINKVMKLLKTEFDYTGEELTNCLGATICTPENEVIIILNIAECYLDTLVHEIAHARQIILDVKGFYDSTAYNNPNQNYSLSETEAYLEGFLFELIYSRIHKHIKHRLPYKVKVKWDRPKE